MLAANVVFQKMSIDSMTDMLLKQQQLLEIQGFNVGELVAGNIQTFPHIGRHTTIKLRSSIA